MFVALQNSWEKLLRLAEKRLPALTRYRKTEALPIHLHSRRVYVLPTRFGYFFGMVLTLMLVGSLNFNNNAALILTFLLSGVMLISMVECVRTLVGIELHSVQSERAFVGDVQSIKLHWHGLGRARGPLHVDFAAQSHCFNLAAEAPSSAVLIERLCTERGFVPIGRIRLWTQTPFGIFYAWSMLNPQAECLIYPRPEKPVAVVPSTEGIQNSTITNRGDDEWAGLRDYRAEDSPRRIAWKASARHDRLLVNETAASNQGNLHLHWQQTQGLPNEMRISRLTAWVLTANATNLNFSLTLTKQKIGPSRGDAHTEQCLRALSLLPK